MKKSYVLCDFKECPLKDGCARYLENMDRTKTVHFGAMPYNNGKCGFFEPFDLDDIIDKVNDILKPFK